ncbi:MAG: hypothetical protein K2P51_07260 [Rhabdochlamydiaceae bacterium]|nr:hypothetical protein [Rhabdochlamydiaceae bacterium]
MDSESGLGEDLPCTDPLFLQNLCDTLALSHPREGIYQFFDLKEEAFYSLFFDLSFLQESFHFRCLRRARILAHALVNDEGQWDQDKLVFILSLLEKEGQIFYAEGLSDAWQIEHVLHILRQFLRPQLQKEILAFTAPLCHLWAEALVRDTLGSLSADQVISDTHVRRAVLISCLHPLRQTLGSCFATAPSILIQREQLEMFLNDMKQLLSTGQLKRTFGGVEYAVPLSPTMGGADLHKEILSIQAQFSPGLIEACIAIGTISAQDSWKQKVSLLARQLQPYLKQPVTVRRFIHEILLSQFQMTEENLSQAEFLERSHAKRLKSSTLMFDPAASKQLEWVHRFRKKEKLACAAYQGICDCALLRAWEYTLASFSEVKLEFASWNLYTSLGLNPDAKGGLGSIIYEKIDEKIKSANQKIQEYQQEYELAFDQLRATEILLKQASSEAQIRRLQAEYRSRGYHMRAMQDMRDQTYSEGSLYSNLPTFLIQQYTERFPLYFQEIYDASMQEFKSDVYEDSPAGFRLVYKHGRTDPFLWTLIYEADQYIDALIDFFQTTEREIASLCGWEGGELEIFRLTSEIILHLRTPLFLESALERVKAAHQKLPSHAKSEGDVKPWGYLSGGTLTTLFKTYCRRSKDFSTEGKWVENESELLIFLLDTLKQLPPIETDPLIENPRRGMLMTSPTHAFILYPGMKEFRQGWQEEGFTYTWVRDQVFLPTLQFYEHCALNTLEQQFLLDEFCRQLPPLVSHRVQRGFIVQDSSMPVPLFRQAILSLLSDNSLKWADEIDSFLYESLPVVSGKEFKIYLRRLFSDRMDASLEKALLTFPDVPAPLMRAKTVRNAAKALHLRAHPRLTLSFDLHQEVANHARYIGLAPPTPLLFADSNWNTYLFGFVVNPGTSRLELWRLDKTATQGAPMSAWRQWLDGTEKSPWVVFTNPSEWTKL